MPFPSNGEDPPSTQEDVSASSAPSGANRADAVVSNTTPLITLGEIGLMDVLRQLYSEVWIPESVLGEYSRGREAHPERPDLLTLVWIRVQPVAAHAQLPASLDVGERDAIALALAVKASRILLDERAARAAATRFGLTITGSVGVLLAAKRRGLISMVTPYLNMLIGQGRYISPALYEQIVRQADE